MNLTDMNVTLSPNSSLTGYGYIQYKMFMSLMKDHKVNLHPLTTQVWVQDKGEISQEYLDFMIKHDGRRIDVFDNCLSINYPTCLQALRGHKSWVYTMYESENVPKRLVDAINKHDYCMVPCDQNIRAFKFSGVKIPIFKVPLGNDQNDYFYVNRNWEITEENPFLFLHIGYMNWRKGGDIAIKAFKKVFPTEKNVRLVMKMSPQYTQPWQMRAAKAQDERIILLKDYFSMEQMRYLYEAAHCYLGCSRGDAWNFLAFQALATGCPSISTNWCGPRDYEDIIYPLNHTIEFSEDRVFGEPWGYYGEPDFNHLCELMDYTFRNPEACQKKGLDASRVIESKYTWKNTTEQIKKLIEEN